MGILSWILNKKKDDNTSSKEEEVVVEKSLPFVEKDEEMEKFVATQKEYVQVFLNNDIEKAKQIVFGYESVPNNIDLQILWNTIVKLASKNDDHKLLLDLAHSKYAPALSKFGKAEETYGQVAIRAIIEIETARKKEFEKTLPKGQTYEMYIKEEVEKLKEIVKENRSTKEDMIKFLEDLPCCEDIEQEKQVKPTMALEEAKNVVDDYASFLSNCIEDRLHWIFHPIPDCLRPYPLDYLKTAFDLVRKDYQEKGDDHKAKLCDEIEAGFWDFTEKDDDTIMKDTAKRCEDIKWKDTIITIVSEFRTRPPHKNYLENYKKISLESIDFDNLDIPTAYKIIQIFSIFLKEHMLFHTLFSAKIPLGFLPFPKEQLFKAIDIYINAYKSIEHENADDYASMKNLINEDYVDNELAINELMKNLSNDETRSALISDLKEYQIKTARTKNIDRLGLTKKI